LAFFSSNEKRIGECFLRKLLIRIIPASFLCSGNIYTTPGLFSMRRGYNLIIKELFFATFVTFEKDKKHEIKTL